MFVEWGHSFSIVTLLFCFILFVPTVLQSTQIYRPWLMLPVLYADGRMVETWTPQGSSSCRRVLMKRLRAALDAPYAARQGNGWSPENIVTMLSWHHTGAEQLQYKNEKNGTKQTGPSKTETFSFTGIWLSVDKQSSVFPLETQGPLIHLFVGLSTTSHRRPWDMIESTQKN